MSISETAGSSGPSSRLKTPARQKSRVEDEDQDARLTNLSLRSTAVNKAVIRQASLNNNLKLNANKNGSMSALFQEQDISAGVDFRNTDDEELVARTRKPNTNDNGNLPLSSNINIHAKPSFDDFAHADMGRTLRENDNEMKILREENEHLRQVNRELEGQLNELHMQIRNFHLENGMRRRDSARLSVPRVRFPTRPNSNDRTMALSQQILARRASRAGFAEFPINPGHTAVLQTNTPNSPKKGESPAAVNPSKQQVFTSKEPDYFDDPEVLALMEQGPLTNKSLEKLPVNPRETLDDARSGFRMLVESKAVERNVAIEKVPEGYFEFGSMAKMKIKLKWVKEPKKAFIVKRPNDDEATAALHSILSWLSSRRIQTVLEENVKGEIKPAKNDIQPLFVARKDIRMQNIDFIICLGGDGTILWATGLFPEGIPPLVSFKMGSLGFLTPFPVENHPDTLKRILQRDMEATIRARIKVTVRKAKETITFVCLNEIVAKHPHKMVSVDLILSGDSEQKITTVHGDGVIIATPTGSTAYSLACGGSILHPALPAMVVTPIAPHTLSFRPIVLADSTTLILRVPAEARSNVFLYCDGRDEISLEKGDEAEIVMSQYPMAAYCMDGENQDWFNTIKQSFLWNVRTDQKNL